MTTLAPKDFPASGDGQQGPTERWPYELPVLPQRHGAALPARLLEGRRRDRRQVLGCFGVRKKPGVEGLL